MLFKYHYNTSLAFKLTTSYGVEHQVGSAFSSQDNRKFNRDENYFCFSYNSQSMNQRMPFFKCTINIILNYIKMLLLEQKD